jgi:inositol oxygenase
MKNMSNKEANPLNSLDQWEDDIVLRYPEPGSKAKEEYRNYDNPARDTVKEFYRLNHTHQTYAFVQLQLSKF